MWTVRLQAATVAAKALHHPIYMHVRSYEICDVNCSLLSITDPVADIMFRRWKIAEEIEKYKYFLLSGYSCPFFLSIKLFLSNLNPYCILVYSCHLFRFSDWAIKRKWSVLVPLTYNCSGCQFIKCSWGCLWVHLNFKLFSCDFLNVYFTWINIKFTWFLVFFYSFDVLILGVSRKTD